MDIECLQKSQLMEYENLDELLIKLVKKFDNIYDKSNGMFKNRQMREMTWNAIAHIMKKPREECLQRWNVLRTRYALERRKTRTESRPSTWPLYHSMAFLDKFMLPRKSYGHYKTVSTTSQLSPSFSNQSRTDSVEPIFVDVELSSDEPEEKFGQNSGALPSGSPENIVSHANPLSILEHLNSSNPSESFVNYTHPDYGPPPSATAMRPAEEPLDAEGAFGRTVELMLKNVRGHKKRRKLQAEIMQLFSKYDSASDTE